MTITWSPALAPELPSFYDEEPEPDPCLSHLYTPPGGLRVGALVCLLDAGHPDSGGPGSDHMGGSDAHPHWWSNAAAAESLVVHRASAKSTGPQCTECDGREQSIGGRCWICAADQQTRDNYETPESEAA